MVSTETAKSAPLGTSSRAPSSPMPSSTLGGAAPALIKKRRMSSNSPRSGSIFLRPRLLRGAVKHGVDELMPIRSAKLLGQLHGLREGHPVRQLGVRLQFVQAQPQNCVLNGIECFGRDLAQTGQAQIQCLTIGSDALDEPSKICQVDPIRLGILSELRLHVLPGERIDLDLIERLQRQAARQTAGPMGSWP